jgi:2-keto-3-deoxy-L-rhamnonate aldolase RhmA
MSLKSKFKNNELTVGTWLSLAHPAIAEIMVKAGFDWVTIDLEHSVITVREAEEMIRIIDLGGSIPLVRLSANDPVQIKRMMDAGARGIIVPMVNSKEDVNKAVAAVHYPEKGTRGVGLARAQGYGATFHENLSWLKNEAVIIVQIEHIDAVEKIEEILSPHDVDGYIIGPYDLSASMGLHGQFDHPDVVAALKKIREAGTALKKSGGLHIVEPNPEELKSRIEEGFRFLAYSVDFRMLDVSCRAGLQVRSNL